MTAPVYDRVALIGLGLIASSMAHAMRAGGLAGEIVGHAQSAETRATALEIGICDRVHDTAAEAVTGADLVVLAVPVGVMGDVAASIGPHLKPGATVTDVGSVKQAVIDAVAPHIPQGADLAQMIARHYDAMLGFYGIDLGVRVARKHLGWYLDQAGLQAGRAALMTAPTPQATLTLIAQTFGSCERRAA